MDYLGKCRSYFAYLKSTYRDPSADAILKLWSKLNTEKNICEKILPTAKSSTQRQILIDWIALYSKLQSEVFGAIKKYG